MAYFFIFFFLSGFCSILYELIWLRLSMAQFGVTTGIISIVLSTFMCGLGLGSLLSSIFLRRYQNLIRSPLCLYAFTELLIGSSAILVPYQLMAGKYFLNYLSLSSFWSYYFVTGITIALILIPWCVCMGATFPIVMLAIKNNFKQHALHSFSYLYFANILGALFGTVTSLFLIELYGFHYSLYVGAMVNGLIALMAYGYQLSHPILKSIDAYQSEPSTHKHLIPSNIGWLLFGTGLTSMGIEVVWVRIYTPYFGTVVYTFAMILGLYLAFNFLGSHLYRSKKETNLTQHPFIWLCLGFTALLPLIVNSQLLTLSHLLCLVVGIAPLSILCGFITPSLIDRASCGSPNKAGVAYAINIAGCILGPLIAGFLLLPFYNEYIALCIFALPWVLCGFFSVASTAILQRYWKQYTASFIFIVMLIGLSYLEINRNQQPIHILRDHTATVVASGEGLKKNLKINGIGITALTTATKMMAHLPLAYLNHPPSSALVICFGMGTTYRSLIAWGIQTTAVELVPSVPRLFKYFHDDGTQILHSPLSHIVIDDGRRFLEHSVAQYDVITIDPPPPVEAASSSLLYSKEFYAIAKKRLKTDGILQQWLPRADPFVEVAVTRALLESFPYVRIFSSNDAQGLHFLASNAPFSNKSANELAAQMPAKAIVDMLEWHPNQTAENQFASLLQNEMSAATILATELNAKALQDDHPVNEYYFLRRMGLAIY